jgi:hypothetical protein
MSEEPTVTAADVKEDDLTPEQRLNLVMTKYLQVSVAGDIVAHTHLSLQILAMFSPQELLDAKKVIPPHQLPDEVHRAHMQGSIYLIKKCLSDAGINDALIKARAAKGGGLVGPDGMPVSLLNP